jgi:RHS repeat-associated protein
VCGPTSYRITWAVPLAPACWRQGQVALAQSYDPFGVPFEASGSGASDYGYTGEWWGSYNDLLFLRARYYDPMVGRFLSQDPWRGVVRSPISLHPYSYVRQNPVRYVDPLGLYSCLTSKQWPADLVGLCLLFDNSPAARNWLYENGIAVGLGLVGWDDAQSMFKHWLGDTGQPLYFGSRLVNLIERDTLSLIEESRTEYLSRTAQEMRGQPGRLPPDRNVNFLSNAEGIPASYLSNFDSPSPYRISEEVYIALGGFPFERTYRGVVTQESQGTYRILLRTDFAANKTWTFAPNTQMYPNSSIDEIPENPPAEFSIADRIGFADWLPRPSLIPPFIPMPSLGGNYWSIYIPDEWGYKLEQQGYATPFLAKGRWAREEELLAVDHNCNGWDIGDIVEGPNITREWLPTSVSPSSSENQEWVYR